ncbi:MAG: hypothetical protein EPN53_08850 [Acidobacteria bacterium]|nr:MAG: hypothetical protein EPN53_08850 [Acidobacteriota bacterium]
MSAEVSLVLVACRSSAVAPVAVAGFRAEAAVLGVSSEVVIVDHSDDEGEQTRLQALAPERLLAQPNRGYAAGINVGVAASSGHTVLVGNPDIAFEPGSVAALLTALDGGWDVVGPQFTLAGWLFPPADLQTPGEQLRRWLAGRSPALWRRELRRELARWRALWDASEPVALPLLSGALLAFRRGASERVGPWDEGYFLYFEETDWLRRAAAAGLRLAQVPRARVEHSWGHAADPEATGEQFARSRRRFLARHHGWRGRLAARFVGARSPLRPSPLPAGAEALPRGRLQWLLSPTALGVPAAGSSGSAQELSGALRGVSAARGNRGRFLVLALEPSSGRLAGVWSWEVGGG